MRGSGGGGSLAGSADDCTCSTDGAGTGGKARLVIEDGSVRDEKERSKFIRMAIKWFRHCIYWKKDLKLFRLKLL